jgi:glutamate-1-semialdehyde 2,1-aminomutase
MAELTAHTETRSRELYAEACEHIPGGVNSPVRTMRSVGRDYPLFIAEAHGATVVDADGTSYIDFVASWGPMILGHAHPAVIDAVTSAARHGTTFGAPTELETGLAMRVKAAYPCTDLVRFTSSGTEAAMSAIRLARSATGRDRILKFAGCYHGHADPLLAAAGSGLATLGIPSSPGVPAAVAADTIVVQFNDDEALDRVFAEHGRDLACAIVEGVPGNMGVVPPLPGFHERLQERCRRAGALFIVDDVMSGFRVARGGAVELYRLDPDLVVLGKIVGGGLPAAAFGGRREVMELLAPLGATYQAGTLSGNPVAMAAGCATLDLLAEPGTYDRLEERSAELEEGLRAAAPDCCVQRVGSMLTLFHQPGPVRSYAVAAASDLTAFGAFHRHCLERGIYLPASQYEAWFVSLAHGHGEIAAAVDAARSYFGTRP